jgi:hypothetical protein
VAAAHGEGAGRAAVNNTCSLSQESHSLLGSMLAREEKPCAYPAREVRHSCVVRVGKHESDFRSAAEPTAKQLQLRRTGRACISCCTTSSCIFSFSQLLLFGFVLARELTSDLRYLARAPARVNSTQSIHQTSRM